MVLTSIGKMEQIAVRMKRRKQKCGDGYEHVVKNAFFTKTTSRHGRWERVVNKASSLSVFRVKDGIFVPNDITISSVFYFCCSSNHRTKHKEAEDKEK